MKSFQEFALHEVKSNKDYFEGWYYKIQMKDTIFSVIFGIHQNQNEKQGFIQTIDNIQNESFYETFKWEDIQMNENPFEVHFKNNILSKDKLILNLNQMRLEVYFKNHTPIKVNKYMPTIMGPFSYLPMECIHSIISLHHECKGTLHYNEKDYDIEGIGYLEKDRGISFPRKYLWFQSNDCSLANSSFFISLATIPFHLFSFTGSICILMLEKEQLRFATYLGCKIKALEVYERDNKTYANIRIKQQAYFLNIRLVQENGSTLKAPKKGRMNVQIHEHLNSEASIRLYKHGSLVYKGVFKHGASEIVNVL